MDLSIIIPVYNVEKYIKECLEPLVRIKKISFEVILVDDGSTDESINIAKEFSSTIPLHIFTQQNGGASKARNTGLAMAQGKYIYFYDSDDVLIPEEFEKLVTKVISENLDLCSGKGMLFTDDGKLTTVKKDASVSQSGILSGPDMFKLMHESKEFSCMLWLRIYRHDFLKSNDLKFIEGIIHEDEEFTARCFALASRVAYYPYDFYRYRYREGSVSKSSNHKYLNPKSVPAFVKIIQKLGIEKMNEVVQISMSKFFVEILRRLAHQKKNGIIREIPSWESLGLEEEFRRLPFVYKIPIHRFRIKQFFI